MDPAKISGVALSPVTTKIAGIDGSAEDKSLGEPLSLSSLPSQDIPNTFQARQLLNPTDLVTIVNKVSGIPEEYTDFLNTPHYNSFYHTEGGINGTLRDHLNEIIDAYNKIRNGETCGLEPNVFKIVSKIISENPEIIEAFTIFHDVGKYTTTKKEENGSHSYKGHEERSFQVLINNKITYNEKSVDNLLKLIIRHHIFAFKVENASHLASLYDFRNDYLKLVRGVEKPSSSLIYDDKEDYYKTLETLIATTSLDLLGSKGPMVTLDSVNKLTMAYENLKAIQSLFCEFDPVKLNVKAKVIESKVLSTLLTSTKPLVSNGEESKELKEARAIIGTLVNPPKPLFNAAQIDSLKDILIKGGYQRFFNPIRTVTSINEAKERLTRMLAIEPDAQTKIETILTIVKEIALL